MNFSPQRFNLKSPIWPLVIIYTAGSAFLLLTNSGSITTALIAYPFISVFPCLFLLTLMSKSPADFGVILPASVMVGPVFSTLVGAATIYIGRSIEIAAPVILASGLGLGVIAIVRRGELVIPRPRANWLPAILFSGFAVSLVVAVLAHSLRIRLLHDGWFHSAVALRIIKAGLPPEDPAFPGETVQNYWFYHAWGAILTWTFQRPPADMYALINVHSLIGAILGAWVLAVEFFKRTRLRMIALFFSILGLNTLGFFYLILNHLLKTKPNIDFESPHILLQFMVFHGEHRIPYFLDKFTPPNAFPLGVCLYAACAYFAIRIIRNGADTLLVVSIFLATLGVFMFHPTTALGLGAGIGCGLALQAVVRKSIRPFPFWIMLATGLPALLSIPYLFSIFPFHAELMEESFLSQNLWNTVSTYPLLAPFLFFGIRHFYRSKDPASIFLIGFLAGTTLAALFLKLPGTNQYKFIQLMCLPAGLLSAAAFNEESRKLFKAILLTIFIIFTAINTVITAYAYVTSPAWNQKFFITEGIHVLPIEFFKSDIDFDRWARDTLPENAIIMTYSGPLQWGLPEMALSAERPVMFPYLTWVSMGHKDKADLREMVKRIFSADPIVSRDIETLYKFKRPLYFVLTPVLSAIPPIASKFDSNPNLFKLVYNDGGYKVYLFEKREMH